MKNKIFAALISIGFLASLAGCGNQDFISTKGSENTVISEDSSDTSSESVTAKELSKGDAIYNSFYALLGGSSTVKSVTEYTTAYDKFVRTTVSINDENNIPSFVHSCYTLSLLLTGLSESPVIGYSSLWINVDDKAEIALQVMNEQVVSTFTPMVDGDPICDALQAEYDEVFSETDILAGWQ